MTYIKGTSRAQTLFLRAFHKHPHGPPPDLWPSPAVLRKWLRRPAFANAFRSLRDTLRTQADLHLALAAAQAAHALTTSLPDPATATTTDDHPDLRTRLAPLTSLLRLAHLRQRFTVDPPPPPRSENSYLAELARTAPSLPLGYALEGLGLPHRTDYNEAFHEDCMKKWNAGLDLIGNPRDSYTDEDSPIHKDTDDDDR